MAVRVVWALVAVLTSVLFWSAPARAIPVFARIYDKPCGTCHTVFPQLNPQGENFRAHGFHGLPPDVKPLKAGSVELPGTLPLALYFAGGEDITKEDEPAHRDPTRTSLNLDFFSLLAGGELGPHLAFLLDYQLVETEADEDKIEIYTLPYQAYVMAHAEKWEWLGNLRAGWYELPLGASAYVHRLSARPYLIYSLNACSLLDQMPPHRDCEDLATLGEPQIGLELNGLQPERGIGWAAGFTNGNNNRLDDTASKDLYLRFTQAFGLHRAGLFLYYSPDIVGRGVHDHALRLGPDLNLYSRQFRLLAQFLAGYESNPTGRAQDLWFYGGFIEGEYRFTTTLLSLLRVDYAWTPRFDDTIRGGATQVRRRLWEVTGGGQWSILQNVKLVAELTYGENHESVGDETVKTWSGTVRLVTAFWPFAPPGLAEWTDRQRAP